VVVVALAELLVVESVVVLVCVSLLQATNPSDRGTIRLNTSFFMVKRFVSALPITKMRPMRWEWTIGNGQWTIKNQLVKSSWFGYK
jgi:hypothetical protein